MWITPPETRNHRTCRLSAIDCSIYADISPSRQLNKNVDNAGEINAIRRPFPGKSPILGLSASGTCVPPISGGAGANRRVR